MDKGTARRIKRTPEVLLLGFILSVATFAFPSPSQAGVGHTFTVDTLQDAVDQDLDDGQCTTSLAPPRSAGSAVGPCSLRAAIMQSNALLQDPGQGPITINLGSGTHLLTIQGAGDDSGASGDLDILHGLTIAGVPGAGQTVVDASGLEGCETSDRAFHNLSSGELVVLTDLTITGGHAAFGNNCNGNERRERSLGFLGPQQIGGGILNDGGTLTLDDVSVQANEAGDAGGGIYNTGTMTLDGSTVRTNIVGSCPSFNPRARAQGAGSHLGGGIANFGTLTVQNASAISENEVHGHSDGSTAAHGGGLYSTNSASVSGSAITDNRATIDPCITRSRGQRTTGSAGESAQGGGIWNGGSLSLSSSLVGDPTPADGVGMEGNEASLGGGIYNSVGGSLLVDASNVDGNGALLRGGGVWSGGNADIENDSTVNLNSAAGNSVATEGGGIYTPIGSRGAAARPNGSSSTTTVDGSTIDGNLAHTGGGISNHGVVDIFNSTVSNNVATFQTQSQSLGGGLANFGDTISENSTFSGNSAGSNGGGIHVDGGDLDLVHVTVADNSLESISQLKAGGEGPPPPAGGGLSDFSGETSHYQATLFAENLPGNCDGSSGSLDSGGDNVADDTSCNLDEPDDDVVASAQVGPLADNGGPTMTHALLLGSPALDQIPGECATSIDQRLIDRPQGSACDVGAFELVPSGGPGPGPGPTPTPTASPSASPSATPSTSPSPTPDPECPGFEGDPRPDVIGTMGVDILEGTDGDDIICAFEGNDVLRGFGGNDLLLAGPDDDRSHGGPGNDRVRSSLGNDRSFGQEGSDEVRGGRGEDLIEGGEGDDLLRGYEDADVVKGGLGNDRVLGFPGDDHLKGDAGDDFVKGGLGDDVLDGGLDTDDCKGGRGQDILDNCELGTPLAAPRGSGR